MSELVLFLLALLVPATVSAQPPRPRPTSVMVELRDGADAARLARLPGVRVAEAGGRAVTWGPYAVCDVTSAGRAALSTADFVRSIRTAPPTGILPLDRSAELLGLPAVRGLTTEGAYGEGVLIGDLDSPIDPFHPAFFHGDGAFYDWIDRDGDGRFGEGDAVDLDGDGIAQSDEVASELRATPIDFYGASPEEVRGSFTFDPGIDWVYLDVNRNGVRDVGEAAGWGDGTPALGEPLFVPDDVDRDGVLDPAERVLQLVTPKIRAHRVDVTAAGGVTHLFERMSNLSTALRDYTGGAYGYADTLHATGVVGILIADVPLIGRRWVGIAPEAEVVVASDIGGTNLDGLMWALSQSPDVVLHEYVLWTTVALDGSDPQSMLMDESTATGVAHACPAGNIGGSRKHAFASLDPSGMHAFELDVASSYLELSTNVPVGSDVRVTLVEPGGRRHAFTGSTTLSDGTDLVRQAAEGPRTFQSLTFAAYRSDGTALPAGTWRLEVTADPSATEAIPVHAFVYDELGFSGGSTFVSDATDASTMAWPSTADSCIAIGASPGHVASEARWFGGEELAGTIRGYSGRGPRLDEARTIGVSAPDNPLTPLGAGDVLPSSPGAFTAPEGAYQIFSGTSGAGPHVAGTLALLASRGTRGAEAIARVRETAISDTATGPTPNDDHGSGRVDAAAALGVARDGSAPRLILRARVEGASVVLEPDAIDDDGDVLSYRWDFDYDGVWDTELASAEPITLPVPFHFKLEVQDPSGRRDQVVLRVLSPTDPMLDAGMPDAGRPDAGARDAGPPVDAGTPRFGFAGCSCRVGAGASSASSLVVLAALTLVLGRRR